MKKTFFLLTFFYSPNNMKKVLIILGFALLFTSCSFLNSDIDRENVNVDDSTSVFTYKNSGKIVTGTILYYEIDPLSGKKYKSSTREVKEGKLINKGFDYFPNGSIHTEYTYDMNGHISGTVKF